MENIAVLIGVSKYDHLPSLPACDSDVSAISSLLAATGKYDEIESITGNTTTSQVKDRLRAFFKRFVEKSIGEAFIYFTGHGVLHRSDVLFCCSNFDPKFPETTSVSNSELDDLLRSVSPALAVKVLDACNSGSPYIKDTEDSFKNAIQKLGLKSFICMASSKLDQSSFASTEGSHFTSRFVEGTLLKESGNVLYRDVQAYIADSFVDKTDQTPFFVIQGTGLETFTEVTPGLLKLKADRSKAPDSPASPGGMPSQEDLILSAVKERDSLYISKDSALRAIDASVKVLKEWKPKNRTVATFYSSRSSIDGTLSSLPSISTIAEFAAEKNWRSQYFLDVIFEKRKIRKPKNNLFAFTHMGAIEYEDAFEQAAIKIVATQQLPAEVARIDFIPAGHPSLKRFSLFIGLVHSRLEVVVLYTVIGTIMAGWDEHSLSSEPLTWQFQTVLWKDVVSDPGKLWAVCFGKAETDIQFYLETHLEKKSPPISSGSAGKPTDPPKTKPA